MLQLLSVEYAKKYVLTTLPVIHIQPFAADAVKECALALYALTFSLVKLLYCFILIVSKLSFLAFPHAVKIFRQIVKFHRTQLSWSDILIEASAIALIISYFVFRKRIADVWKRIDRYISAKSKAAAAAAPHILFFTGAFVFTILGKKFILPFTSSTMMPVFTLVVPMLRSFSFVRTLHNDTNQNIVHRKKYYPLLSQLLTLWVVLGTYHSIVTVLALAPFSARILLYLPYLKELIIVILLWIQISPGFTKIVYTSIISPVIIYLSKYIPTAQNGNAPDQHKHYVVMLLRMSRVFQDHHLDFIGKLLEDSVVTIMAMIFICLPNPFATMGMMTITCLLPAFRAVTITDAFRIRGVGERNVDPVIPMYLLDKALFWLYYWIAFAWLWIWRIYVTPIWPSVTIIVALWLQHIFFAGGKYVVITSIDATNVVIQRNQQRPLSHIVEETDTHGTKNDDNAAEDEGEEHGERGNEEGDEEITTASVGEESLVSDSRGQQEQQDRSTIDAARRRMKQQSPSVENPDSVLLDDLDLVYGEDDVVSPDASTSVRRRNRLS